jgi:alkaline phosphatase D
MICKNIVNSYLKIIFIIVNFSNSESKTINPENLSKLNRIEFGFGSCLHQDRPMPIFEAIKRDSLDFFLMIGDNVYGDTERIDLHELKLAYKKQKNNFRQMKLNFPFEAIWDDHDYGLNDGGKDYKFKEASKELFLNFWNVSEDDKRRIRPGLYYELSKMVGDKIVQFLFLDTRTFRDPLVDSNEKGSLGKERYIPSKDTSLTMLGEFQWKWVERKINKSVDFRIIISPIQFLPIGHGWESWNNLPHERARLINLVEKSDLNNTLFISGDRHRGGAYEIRTKSNKRIIEMTSSSLNVSYPNKEELGPFRLGSTFIEENYGTIFIDSKENLMLINLKSINGSIMQRLRIKN